ncbi:MAG: aminoglycoside 6-adenylyltransferase [Paenibacillaceae bacterium]
MYQSKHVIRDEKLPDVRDKMLDVIIDNLKKKSGTEAIFLGGSLANDNHDIYSDIDLRIVVTEDHYDEYISNKQQIVSEFGEVLFYEDLYPSAPYTIAHYSTFIKVDMFIYAFSRFTPSIWVQNMKIIYDPSGQLQRLKEQSNMIIYKVTKDDVKKWRGKVFSYIHEVYRRVMREEYYYALTMMNNLRSCMVSGWNMEVDRHSNDLWDWSKIEGSRSRLDKGQLEMLENWFCNRDQEAIMETLSTIIPEFRRLHNVLCDKTGLESEEQKLDRIINQVL